MGSGEGPCDRLPYWYQKIPAWLIKIMFPGETETAIRSNIKSRFGVMGFQMPFWAFFFFLFLQHLEPHRAAREEEGAKNKREGSPENTLLPVKLIFLGRCLLEPYENLFAFDGIGQIVKGG